MNKCWYCNNELTSGDNPKHFGICNKCYDEMFKSGDTIIRSLTNKIEELKKQLERHNKYFNSFGCDSFDEFTDFISTFMLTPHEEQTLIKDLKKQLEEKEKMLEEYKKCNCKECMTDYEKNLNQIIDKYLYENNSLKQQVEKLKGDKK